jgi:hypothetical protein
MALKHKEERNTPIKLRILKGDGTLRETRRLWRNPTVKLVELPIFLIGPHLNSNVKIYLI